MNPKITVKGSKLTIAAFECEVLGKVGQKTIDLADQAGEYVRIWLEKDGTYSTDKHKDHFWQVAELRAPVQQVNVTMQKDSETGEDVETWSAAPLDLDKVEIHTFELPK
jgi:hypothetical protein